MTKNDQDVVMDIVKDVVDLLYSAESKLEKSHPKLVRQFTIMRRGKLERAKRLLAVSRSTEDPKSDVPMVDLLPVRRTFER